MFLITCGAEAYVFLLVDCQPFWIVFIGIKMKARTLGVGEQDPLFLFLAVSIVWLIVVKGCFNNLNQHAVTNTDTTSCKLHLQFIFNLHRFKYFVT